MIPTLVGDICIFRINLLVANLTGVGDVKMFPMSAFNVVLHSVKLCALLCTQETGVAYAPKVPGTATATRVDAMVKVVGGVPWIGVGE